MKLAKKLILAALFLSHALLASEMPTLSHKPMLGAVTDHAAKIWLRTTEPSEVTCTLTEVGEAAEEITQRLLTSASSDNTSILTFDKLKKETKYQYVVRVGETEHQGTFTTLGSSLKDRGIRLTYGSCCNLAHNKMPPGTSVFQEMASRKADLNIFLGDFPYTARGEKNEIRKGHQRLRSAIGFSQLTSSTPTYGIYDDHDFGPNDCDGTHRNADGALAAFKEYWPNPSYGLPKDKGIYCAFVVGDVEFFLLDGRHPARKAKKTMLGETQFKWLCDRLKKSESRYKVLVSGTPFARIKGDCWAGEHYLNEREKLFTFIFENKITGVIGISGDSHRSDVSKLPMGKNGKDRYFYDFTSGALSQNHRAHPEPKPETLIHTYWKAGDNNMFGELDFRPAVTELLCIGSDILVN